MTHPDPNVPSVSFEFFPPKTEKMAEKLWDSVSQLAPVSPVFVSVTYGAGGSTRDRTHDTVRRMVSETPLNPAAHLTCVSATKEDVGAVVDGYWDAGVRHIVALRGDPPEGMGAKFQPHPGGYKSSVDLIETLSQYGSGQQGFDISVSCYPEPHPDSTGHVRDFAFLKAKQDAGASRAISQFFFDSDVFLRFRDEAAAAGITMPLLPGIMLQPNFAGLKRIAGLCGASIPDWLHTLYQGTEDNAKVRHQLTVDMAVKLCEKLKDEGISHFHFYTLNRADLALETCMQIGVTSTEEAAVS